MKCNIKSENIIKKMYYCLVEENTYIFKQNDKACCYFVIDKGELVVEVDGIEKKIFKPNNTFGELAWLYNAPRKVSIRANKNTYLWGLSREIFKKYIEDSTIIQLKDNFEFIKDIPIFKHLNYQQKIKVSKILKIVNFKTEEIIFSKDDELNSYFVIKEGEISCYNETGEEIKILKKFDYFGEKVLFRNKNNININMKAKTNVVLLSIDKIELQKAWGCKINVIINKNLQKFIIENNPKFKNLSKIQIEKWIRSSQIIKFEKDDIILGKNNTFKYFLIILQGEFLFENKAYPKESIIGEELIDIFDKNEEFKISEDIICSKKAIISKIRYTDLYKLFGNNFKNTIKINKEEEEKLNEVFDEEERKKEILKKEIKELEEIKVLKKLGEGNFGNVYLITSNIKNSDNLFALKTIYKKQIIKQKIKDYVENEKKILKKLNHKMVCKLYKTFKELNFIFLLIEHIKGIELFDVLRELDLLDNNQARYYIGSLILVLEYLNNNNIIYRDLKPENIMIRENGTVCLIDFGMSNLFNTKNGFERTYTIVGTPHYMAPEILTSKGYDCSCDLWSLGILLYEFMIGKVPFGEDIEDPYEVYELIIKGNVKFPTYFVKNQNKLAKNLIVQLLSKYPDSRLRGDYNTLKAHPWFDDFNFNKLYLNEINPPYLIPKKFIIQQNEIDILKENNKNLSQELNFLHKKYSKEKSLHIKINDKELENYLNNF